MDSRGVGSIPELFLMKPIATYNFSMGVQFAMYFYLYYVAYAITIP